MSAAEVVARKERLGESGPRLRAVPDLPVRVPRLPFVLLVLLLAGAGLVGLLLLNTSLQQGAFTLQSLQTRAKQDQDQQVGLQRQLADLQAPAHLATAARSLGMVPDPGLAFLRLSDGAVLGQPEAATGPPPPAVGAPRRPSPRAAAPSAAPAPPAAAPTGKTAGQPTAAKQPAKSVRKAPAAKPGTKSATKPATTAKQAQPAKPGTATHRTTTPAKGGRR